MEKGTLYWITGLSGAGKTTIGNALYYELKQKQDNLIILDGDILKKLVGDSLGYSKEDRRKRACYYSNLCKILTDQGISVIICTIAMYDSVREWNRENIERYVEVFLRVSKDILLKRDRKGLYSGHSKGKIVNVAGMDQGVEFPKHPDIIIENDGTRTVAECVKEIVEYDVKVTDTFNRDVEYWNQYYKEELNEIKQSSDFAKFVLPYMERRKKVMDIGCGNGRDSLFFVANGMEVTGIDASETAIRKLNQLHIENSLFVCDDFVTCKALYQMQYDYFYSRWTLHAISERQEEALLKNISDSIKKGGLLFIEARSVGDELYGAGKQVARNAFVYNDHFRRFIVKDELINKLEGLGFEMLYAEEEKDFSKTSTSNPMLIRIIANKKNEV
ncbi:MAG: adenylyl-sulfate kinase [Lachnospiraceae bacterium]|nr:adenylyl-sulfate kinase [Lachnospiraceae bacterium]